MNLQHHIDSLIEHNKIDEALKSLDNHVAMHPEDAEGWYLRGKVRWRLGDQSGALSDYGHAADLNPEGPGKTALEHTRAIVDFFNPDLLNP